VSGDGDPLERAPCRTTNFLCCGGPKKLSLIASWHDERSSSIPICSLIEILDILRPPSLPLTRDSTFSRRWWSRFAHSCHQVTSRSRVHTVFAPVQCVLDSLLLTGRVWSSRAFVFEPDTANQPIRITGRDLHLLPCSTDLPLPFFLAFFEERSLFAGFALDVSDSHSSVKSISRSSSFCL
jgi:hypothetical protein